MRVSEKMARVATKIQGFTFILFLIIAGASQDPKIWQLLAMIPVFIIFFITKAIINCYEDDHFSE